MHAREAAGKILSYWFGQLKDGWPTDDRSRLWFGARPEDDRHMLENFGSLIRAAETEELDSWLKEAGSCVALIVLADQMTRAVRRGSKDAFDGDPVALAASHSCIASGMHLDMPAVHRVFSYMPLMHSEDISDQDLCVAMFERLANDCRELREQIEKSLKYAILHRDIIRQFGRFPHRNEALERASTEAEKRHLADRPQKFGQ